MDHTRQEERTGEGRASVLCKLLLLPVYQRVGNEAVRSRIRNFVLGLEGGPSTSLTIRAIFRQFHSVDVGLHSPGPCRMRPNVFHAGTSIGRYCYVAETVRTFTRNHPMNLKSTHGFFYNAALGKVKGGPIQFNRLTIGNGVWIGHNAIILHPAERIGDGAIIAPGSVVYTNVPPYAIVSGFPATVTGYRFSKEVIAALIAAAWWKKSPDQLEETWRSISILTGTDPSGDMPVAGAQPSRPRETLVG